MKKVTVRKRDGSYKREWRLEFKDWVYLCLFLALIDFVVWECIR